MILQHQSASGDVFTGEYKPLPVTATPVSTAPGWTTYRNPSLSSTPVVINAAAGNVYGLHFINPNTVSVYVKIYDSAAPVVGTTTPKRVIHVPAGNGAVPGEVWVIPDALPVAYCSAAISVAAVTDLADNGTTAPTTPVFCDSIQYK